MQSLPLRQQERERHLILDLVALIGGLLWSQRSCLIRVIQQRLFTLLEELLFCGFCQAAFILCVTLSQLVSLLHTNDGPAESYAASLFHAILNLHCLILTLEHKIRLYIPLYPAVLRLPEDLRINDIIG